MKKYIIVFFILVLFCCFYSSNETSTSFIYPTSYTQLSSTYGNRILSGKSNFHNGIDFLAPAGSDIYATSAGYIIYASFLESGYGNTIIINHGNNIKSLYCHVSENFIVTVGQFVSQGELIGYVGPKYLANGMLNGNTTGPHLHFSIFVNNSTINPLDLLDLH